MAHTEFDDLVRKGRPKSKKGGKARKGGHTSSWEAPGAKRRRGRDDGCSATDDSDSGAASSSTFLTGTTPGTGKSVRGKPRGAGSSNTYTRQAAQQQREAAEKASKPDRKSQGSPFPITVKQKKGHKRDRSLSSTRNADSDHRRKRHSVQDSPWDPDQSSMDESAAAREVKAKKSNPSSGPRISGGGSGFARKEPDSTAVPIDSQHPGNGTVPESKIRVETADGRIAYEGTPEEPILNYEDCVTPPKAGKPPTKIWTVDMLQVEQEGLKNLKKPIATISSPLMGTLPHLPTWGSPNGWDYWGRPWAYMDAPHNHPDLKIQSVHKPPAARVTIAVLVNCEHEPQYFLNLDVAKSAAAACTWWGKKGKVVDGDGNYNSSDIAPAQVARWNFATELRRP